MNNKIMPLLGSDLADVDLVRELELAQAKSETNSQFDCWCAEIAAHEEHGFSIPTRDELIDTSGDFFVHLMMERE
ncbi:MAG TPA: hypothetical protein PKZ32_00280 [Candidatus Melainabacteria bacterium]|nr:hypothetical protein [Candidatus Melainabacteria bacterium]